MLFQISWIKTVRETPHNISCLMDAPDEALVRDFCWKNSIVIFSVVPYVGQKEAFGKVFFKVSFGSTTYELVTTFDKINEAYMFYAEVGLSISYINNFEHPLTDTDVTEVMQKLEAGFSDAQKKVKKVEPTDIGNVVLEADPELEKMKRIAWQALTDIAEVKTKAGSSFAMRKLTDLKWLEDELRKVRMGSNVPKMRSLVSESYRIMEEIEMEYLNQAQAAETSVIENSFVTHLDLVREYEKYEKAQKVKSGNLEKTPSDMYYIFFGKLGIYQRFLSKDISTKLGDRSKILYNSIDHLITFIFMCIVWLTISSVYQHYILRQEVFFFAFVDFWLIGMILLVINKLKKESITQILTLFGIGTVVYIIIRYLLINNFAL